MEKFFSISETAKIVGTTSETLRHYDRIGLVKPNKIDKWTKYRYYSEEEIVRLNLVKTLRCMDFPLDEIKKILKSDDFKEIVEFLEKAEQSANEKIEELIQAKRKIRRAKLFYESKQTSVTSEKEAYTRIFPQRVILLSQTLTTPTVGNLWNYLRHFYAQIGEDKREEFAFEDLAGIYQTEGAPPIICGMHEVFSNRGAENSPRGKISLRRLHRGNAEGGFGKITQTGKKRVRHSSGVFPLSGRAFGNVTMELPNSGFYRILPPVTAVLRQNYYRYSPS